MVKKLRNQLKKNPYHILIEFEKHSLLKATLLLYFSGIFNPYVPICFIEIVRN